MEKEICRKIMFSLVALFLLSVDGLATTRRKTLAHLEVKKELKRLNKPAMKTIKSEEGDIIDCFDIYKQPAFENPLLKNHTIQMRPSTYYNENISSSKLYEQLWHKSGSCPEGTVPILRTPMNELLEGISLDASSRESAKLSMDDDVYGGEAVINVWSVHVEPNDFSTASIFIGRRDTSDLITAGWMVQKNLFGDYATRYYGLWHSNNGGCYNLKCPGFVQTSQIITLGLSMKYVSKYDGEQLVIRVKMFMDSATGNWWLVINDVPVGYWPGSLFTKMATGADYIQWGGQIFNSQPGGNHTTTQMGSGHFPNEGFRKAAFFNECIVFYEDLVPIIPSPASYETQVTKPHCYGMSDVYNRDKKDGGVGFFYGGPGCI